MKKGVVPWVLALSLTALSPAPRQALGSAPAKNPAPRAGAVMPASKNVIPHAGMLRYPDVSDSYIVFVYANDLWLVPREGGLALPLASPKGSESFPRFSPDGQSIGFMGDYEGGLDLYTIPVTGGPAHRVTHHPGGEVLTDWTQSGDLLFFGRGLSPLRSQTQLFTVSPTGGLPARLPVPYGANGSISADGRWLAYTPHSRDARTWKRYRGGMATDIWLYNLIDNSARKITDWEGTDSLPMWHNHIVYYLSDGGPAHRLNLWSFDTVNERRQQLTFFKDFDVKWPSIGPGAAGQGEVVFQNGSQLYLYNIQTQQSDPVSVSIPGDQQSIREKKVDMKKFIADWNISSTGKRAVVEARGDIWTLPAENGIPRNLTRTNGIAERTPTWSPDKRWIAYFSDKSGEYELYTTQSDGKGETKQLTSGGGRYRYNPTWSPDSKKIAFTDKSGALFLHTIESKETKLVDVDAQSSAPSFSFSHDSGWIAYSKTSEASRTNSIYLYEVEKGESHQVTSDMFNDNSPVFDRKGEYLYFRSNRSFNPSYGDLDTSFIYASTAVLLAVPLKADTKSPWAPESDEETWEDEKKDEDKDGEGEEEDKDEKKEDSEGKEDENTEAKEGDEEEGDEPDAEPTPDDGISGTWEGSLSGQGLPSGGVDFSVDLSISADNSATGSVTVPMGTATIDSGTWSPETKELTAQLTTDDGSSIELAGKVSGTSMSGTITSGAMGLNAEFKCERTSGGDSEDSGDKSDPKSKDKEKAKEKVEIDLDGFERRAILLPTRSGNFGKLAVNDKNQLIYARFPARGSSGGSPSIQLFDLKDKKKAEKKVASGASYEISSDGKKLIVVRGNSAAIQNASAGASGKNVVTSGMNFTVDPRTEWKQIFTDAWRIMRDFFYDPNMHGVNWQRVHDNYGAMIADCVSRRDVGFVIGEMISELNVGHAYVRGAGDVETSPSPVSVGLLGVDFALNNGAYQIKAIVEGAPWDADARGPLSQPGIDVKVGDYLLAVNGVPLTADQDPYAAFIGTSNKVTTLTVSEEAKSSDKDREVHIKPIANESNLRYRAWIEKNRALVAEKTGGKVGYIYVPNTGINGQNDLIRQFYGQLDKQALIIDERWNGGGQIPTRFIELLNRPITNYWAVRDGKDWPWPPDSHQGPKCMLINGLAGSGGDAFPAYFRQTGLGKLIGTRTWGGLVGISGNPTLIDGGAISAPTFAFYEKDGTWGIEGHGVDPDIEVIDDPSLMTNGKDPQLEAAIELMLTEIERSPYRAPARPGYPNRSGMGLPETDH